MNDDRFAGEADGSRQPRPLSRREFGRVTVLGGGAAALAACSPAAAPPQPPSGGGAPASGAKQAWEQEWDDLVAAARREGQLSLITTTGTAYRQAAEAFEKAFPGITVDQQGFQASIFAPRVLQERDAGLYNYDVITTTYGTVPLTLIPKGVMDPVRPLLFRPDVLDDKVWLDGFEAGFPDFDKKWGFAAFVVRSRHFWVNTTMVKDGEITKVADLLNPKWKGQMIGGDPRTHGGGWWPGTFMRLGLKDDTIIKRLWKDQEVTLSRDLRQMTESMVRGKYAIGIGAVSETIYADFVREGLGKEIKPIEMDYGDHLSGGSDLVYLFNRAPHPNAAKLFVNWLLTKETGAMWAKIAESNSRRVDVEPNKPELMPAAGRHYPQADSEQYLVEYQKTQDLAKAALN